MHTQGILIRWELNWWLAQSHLLETHFFYLAAQQERSNPETSGDSGRMRGVDVSCTGFQCLLLQQN